jgi:hypothetical protein
MFHAVFSRKVGKFGFPSGSQSLRSSLNPQSYSLRGFAEHKHGDGAAVSPASKQAKPPAKQVKPRAEVKGVGKPGRITQVSALFAF